MKKICSFCKVKHYFQNGKDLVEIINHNLFWFGELLYFCNLIVIGG